MKKFKLQLKKLKNQFKKKFFQHIENKILKKVKIMFGLKLMIKHFKLEAVFFEFLKKIIYLPFFFFFTAMMLIDAIE